MAPRQQAYSTPNGGRTDGEGLYRTMSSDDHVSMTDCDEDSQHHQDANIVVVVRCHDDNDDSPPNEGSEVERRESFVEEFVKSKGSPQIVILCLLLAFGFGSTIGVVPAVVTDRYARLHHGYSDEADCSSYESDTKPAACLAGSADAQNAVAWEQFLSNALTFFTSSLMGSLSDEYGRRGLLTLGVAMSCLSPLTLLLLQLRPEMSPNWYYAVGAIQGLVNWMAIALSALSDVMPPKWRAPSFGLLLAGFSLGFAMAPALALFLGHVKVTVLSLTTVSLGWLVIVFFFPETLSPASALEAQRVRTAQMEHLTTHSQKILWNIYRPIWELSILNRNNLFRTLSMLAFFSGLASAGNQSLFIYYIEERLNFKDADIAKLFMMMGLLGILVQGVFLKFINDLMGERRVVILAFVLGFIHNILYGVAEDKATIFAGVAIGAFVLMAFPTISAIKSNNVDESEQGRIQGALYSLSALASATGPMFMRIVYHYTKDGAYLGPGSMFVAASFLYVFAVICAYFLPDAANSKRRGEGLDYEDPSDVVVSPHTSLL